MRTHISADDDLFCSGKGDIRSADGVGDIFIYIRRIDAADIVGFENLKDVLSGMTALATSESDPIAPAKILCTFAEKNPNFVIKAGFVEGNLLDENGVKDLAKTPSKEVLIGKMLGSLQSSLYSFAYVLQAIIDKSGEAPVAEEATEAAAE